MTAQPPYEPVPLPARLTQETYRFQQFVLFVWHPDIGWWERNSSFRNAIRAQERAAQVHMQTGKTVKIMQHTVTEGPMTEVETHAPQMASPAPEQS